MSVDIDQLPEQYNKYVSSFGVRLEPRSCGSHHSNALTPMQQQKRKELLAELHSRRENGEEVVIFRNKIVAKQNQQNFH